ncbi:MAG: MFS transporter [Planctomycetota bacterium]|nr:MFS transporter [Planctomycetota bacterium]
MIANRQVVAWALYDWANSAWALSVLAVLFPLFLGSYWSDGDSGASVTARLSWITAGANLVVAVLAPIFGTIADKGGYRKRFLVILASIGATATAALGLVGQGDWPLALALYLFASIGFYSSTVFYDSLLIDVTPPRNFNFVSSLGFALGYLGGALLLGLHVWMLRTPASFGLENSVEAIRAAFATVGVWWAVFSLPLVFFVPEIKRGLAVGRGVVRAAYAELRATLAKISQYRNIVFFLIAYLLYMGGVFTVISMAANYGQRLGFGAQDLVVAFLITNFAGFPATLLYGFFSHRFGPKPGIYFALAVYIIVSSWAVFMTDVKQFYIMAIIIGCVQGGVQALSRSLYAAMIPPDQSGEFFGFYNMTTKAAHVIGPAMVGFATIYSDAPQIVLLALLPLFIAGTVLLMRVKAAKVS